MLGWYANHRGTHEQFNPMYTYSQVVKVEPPGGSFPNAVLAIAFAQGNDTLAHYSHGVLDFGDKPNASEQANAANYKISEPVPLFDNGQPGGVAGEDAIQTELAKGHPVALGMRLRTAFGATSIYDKTSLSSATIDDTSSYFVPNKWHELLALGYDQTGLWIQNSWGQRWGWKGLARLTWRVVERDVYSAYTTYGFATQTGPVVTKDTTPPTMGPVSSQFPLNQVVTSTSVPVTFSWSASDPSGITAYAVYVSIDGGQYSYQQPASGTGTTYAFSLSIGHSYQVAVAAKDGAGNWSSYSYSAKVVPAIADDTTFTISSPWARQSVSDTLGGTVIATAAAGAFVSKAFTGTDAALIGVKASNAGQVTVYCDGSSTAVGDFFSSTIVTRQIGAFCHFQQRGQHTMEVVNAGTAGRPSLFVDAFAILQ